LVLDAGLHGGRKEGRKEGRGKECVYQKESQIGECAWVTT
jgi:hypothetical protein